MENSLTRHQTPSDWHREPGMTVAFTIGQSEQEMGRIEAVVEGRVYVKAFQERVWPSRKMVWLHEIDEVIAWTP